MFVAWQVERVLRDTVSKPLDRRQFLTLSGLAISAQPFHALACRSPTKPGSEPYLDSVGYGPLQPVNDQTTVSRGFIPQMGSNTFLLDGLRTL